MDLVADVSGNLDYSIIAHHRLFLSRLYIAVPWFECNAPYGSTNFAAVARVVVAAGKCCFNEHTFRNHPSVDLPNPAPSQPIDVGMIVDSIFFHVWPSLIDRGGAAERRDRIRG
jgi:hypothetical protein